MLTGPKIFVAVDKFVDKDEMINKNIDLLIFAPLRCFTSPNNHVADL